MRFGFLFILLLFTGCGASKKMLRTDCEEKVKLALLAQLPPADTVVKYRDTLVYVPGDSVIAFVTMWDTVIHTVTKDRVQLQYVVKHDTVRINAKCLPDTVYLKIPYTTINQPVRKVELPDQTHVMGFWNIFWLIVAFLFFVVLIYFHRKT